MYYLFTNTKIKFFNSLQKYFTYILNHQLKLIYSSELVKENDIIFVLKDEKENPELLDIVANNNSIKILVIGYDNSSKINLLDFINLKKNFAFTLSDNDSQSCQLFTDNELKEKLKNFYHSHGEDSLFEYLSWAIYYLREGPILLITHDISYRDYVKKFLDIGIKNWNLFKERYLRYKYFVKFSNFIPSFDDLENLINDADDYVSQLKKMDRQAILKRNKNFFREKIGKIKKIDEILTTLYKEFYLGETRA